MARQRRASTKPLRRRLAAALCAAIAATGAGAATLTEHMEIRCLQQAVSTLRCSYRLRTDGALRAVSATHGDIEIGGELVSSYPGPADVTAVLVVVARGSAAMAAPFAAALDAMLTAARPHHRFGLAAIADGLDVLAPAGSDAATIIRAATAHEPAGGTGTHAAGLHDALGLLAATAAARRVLVLLCDDVVSALGPHHAALVDAARAAGVVVHGVGFPRAVGRAPALQDVHRLSDATGGSYLQAAPRTGALPAEHLAGLLRAADSGGEIAFDLAPLFAADAQGAVDLTLSFDTPAQRLRVLAPVLIPRETARAPRPLAVPPPSTAAPAAGGATAWYLGTVALAVAGGAMLVIVLARRHARRRGAAPALAWVLRADGPRTRHAIRRVPWRIGRGRNNDLVLDDPSLSRLHAEIRRDVAGQLTLHDLESLNGVFVNDNRTEQFQLREGDTVDIGDVRLYYTEKDTPTGAQSPS